MEEIKLDVQLRSQIGSRKVKAVHQEKCVPAIVYGGEENPLTIKVDRSVYERIMRHHQGQSVIFHLNVLEGQKKVTDCPVIVKEEQHAPVSDDLLHIDFHRISLSEELEVKVPIVTKGEAAGVKNDGGSLDHVIWELDIICLPTNIPEKITIDVTNLKIHDTIHVKDIVLPEGVRTEHDPEAILVAVVPPMKDAETLAAEGEEDAEPEVIKEKKAEEGTEEKAEEKSQEEKAKE